MSSTPPPLSTPPPAPHQLRPPVCPDAPSRRRLPRAVSPPYARPPSNKAYVAPFADVNKVTGGIHRNLRRGVKYTSAKEILMAAEKDGYSVKDMLCAWSTPDGKTTDLEELTEATFSKFLATRKKRAPLVVFCSAEAHAHAQSVANAMSIDGSWMSKATFTLPDGTSFKVDVSPHLSFMAFEAIVQAKFGIRLDAESRTKLWDATWGCPLIENMNGVNFAFNALPCPRDTPALPPLEQCPYRPANTCACGSE